MTTIIFFVGIAGGCLLSAILSTLISYYIQASKMPWQTKKKTANYSMGITADASQANRVIDDLTKRLKLLQDLADNTMSKKE